MPNLTSMNGSATGNLMTTQEIVEGKLLADSMLESLLSNLHNVEETSQGLETMLYVIAETPAIQKMISAFFKKIKRSSSYLSSCSVFQKRILLFSIVECLFSGQNLELRFTSEHLTPLETILQRLGDVWVACEKDVDEDELRKMYIQTAKQAVIMFLKNNQSVEASKILVVNRHRLAEEYQEILQDMIKHCSESGDLLEELEEMPEHNYATYCAAMADFLEGLNGNLEESMLKKFSNRMNAGSSDDLEEGPGGDHNEPDGAVVRQSPPRSSSPALSSGIVSEAEQISEPGVADGHQHDRDICSELDPSEDGKKHDLNSISPKICLSYRLKKQNHRSGEQMYYGLPISEDHLGTIRNERYIHHMLQPAMIFWHMNNTRMLERLDMWYKAQDKDEAI